jgi:hypothetical protein
MQSLLDGFVIRVAKNRAGKSFDKETILWAESGATRRDAMAVKSAS